MDKTLEQRVDAYIDTVWDQVLADIAKLVGCPSVADTSLAEPAAPFGPDVRRALDCALGIAQRLGYDTADDEGYLGWGDIAGERPGQVATIAHVDVVPAGPGWSTDPFTMERREGWLLGRGVIDDKGPAVLSLYAGAFFLHEGITPRYSFRALLGCDEEAGMSDVKHYLAGHESPAFLFTPDASFPVCNAEKGSFGGSFVSGPITDGVIRSWSGAEATNAVPSESVLVVGIDASALPEPRMNADRLTIESAAPGEARILAQGIGGHASLPEGTLNAIGLIVSYLGEIRELLAPAERDYLALLELVHADTAGEAVGIACSSTAFGALTLNAGTIAVRPDGRIEQTIDVRFPDATTTDAMEATLAQLASRFGASFVLGRSKDPFSVDAGHPAVQALLDVYREVTGREAEPFSMGGGTYARNFARAVSFGPEDEELELPAWAGSMHGPNEAASEEALKEALKIYILALVRLMGLEL